MKELIFDCPSCKTKHSILVEAAQDYCHILMKDLLENASLIEGANKKDFSIEPLFGESRGQMFGVLICEDPVSGERINLKAFSGQFNGKWIVPGWAPPLIDVEEFAKKVALVDPILKDMTKKINKLEDSLIKTKMIQERKAISRRHMKAIHSMYTIKNFRGESTDIFSFFNNVKGIPAGTGDCCAPKLINQAINLKLKPLSLAEFFFGKENRSGFKKHGAFYSPCKEKCQSILGYMLCGAS